MSLPRYSSYKDSGVEWLGEVPSHWSVSPLKSVASVINGYPFESEMFDPSEGYPLIRIRDINSSTTEVFYKGTLVESAKVDSSDLIIGMDGDFNVGSWKGQGIALLNQRMCCVRSENSNLIKALKYSLSVPLKLINDITYATTVKHLSSSQVERIKVCIPPEKELALIAEFLDRETGKIDGLVAEQERLIALLTEKRQAVISHAVTKGLNPSAPMKPSGIDWLGDIPAHWDVRALKHIVSTPITDGPHETPDFPDEGIPFVSAEAVSSGKIDFAKIRGFISEKDHKKYSEKYKPQRNDIYMIKSGATTGVTAIVDTDADFNIWSPLAAIRCGEASIPRFVLNFMRSKNFLEAVTLNWSFGTQQNIGMGVIENLSVTIPPIKEQADIADHLELMTVMFDKLISEANKAISLLQERRTALISAAVTGKIDVRGTKPQSEAA